MLTFASRMFLKNDQAHKNSERDQEKPMNHLKKIQFHDLQLFFFFPFKQNTRSHFKFLFEKGIVIELNQWTY